MFRALLPLMVVCQMIAVGPLAAAAAETIGTVKNLKGTVTVARAGSTIPAAPGMPLQEGDVVTTGERASIGIILHDDTLLSLGPGSTLELREYQFKPQEERFSVILRLLRGTFVYLSGVIGKLAPETIRVETPDATIAVRGTRLLIKVN